MSGRAMQTATVDTSYGAIIADPLFKAGYNEIWDGIESRVDVGWHPAEEESYGRGRAFGIYVKAMGQGRVPLSRGFLAHPRALHLLMLAMLTGDVL